MKNKVFRVRAATTKLDVIMPSMTSEVLHLLYAIAEAQEVAADEYLKRVKGKTEHPGYQDRLQAGLQIRALAEKLEAEYKERWKKK